MWNRLCQILPEYITQMKSGPAPRSKGVQFEILQILALQEVVVVKITSHVREIERPPE